MGDRLLLMGANCGTIKKSKTRKSFQLFMVAVMMLILISVPGVEPINVIIEDPLPSTIAKNIINHTMNKNNSVHSSTQILHDSLGHTSYSGHPRNTKQNTRKSSSSKNQLMNDGLLALQENEEKEFGILEKMTKAFMKKTSRLDKSTNDSFDAKTSLNHASNYTSSTSSGSSNPYVVIDNHNNYTNKVEIRTNEQHGNNSNSSNNNDGVSKTIREKIEKKEHLSKLFSWFVRDMAIKLNLDPLVVAKNLAL